MKDFYKILMAEDTPTDVYLAEREIKKTFPNYDLKIVETSPDFIDALNNYKPDIILSDYRMPIFDGLQALKLTLEHSPLTPFILVTGSINEETAVECMKAGASDYIIKEHIRRLGSAMKNAIDQQNIKIEKIRAQEQLLENEKMYRLLFEGNPQPMLIFDIETLNFIEVNQAAINQYNYTRDEFLSMNLKDIHSQQNFDLLLKTAGNTDNKYSLSGEWSHYKKNGDLIIVEIISQNILFKGKPARHILVNDITARKKVEKQIMLLGRTIEQSPVSVMITDINGSLVYVNPKFSEVTGYPYDEIIGKNPRILRSGYHSPVFYKELWDTISNGKNWFGEFRNKRKNGELYWDKSLITPLIDEAGNISNYIAVQEDITEFKKLTNDLIKTKNKAEESDKLKTAFLHTISHEIRTPVNAIVGFSEFLKNQNIPIVKKDQFIDIIISSSQQLLAIINDIVNMATIETGQEKIIEKPTNINAICKLIYEQYVKLAYDKNLQFNYTVELDIINANVLSDETKLLQILSNLVGNAIKFTLNGFVNFGYVIKNNLIEFYVKDSGIGIPKKLHRDIFLSFRQVDYSHTRKFGGSGLGLSISKGYVDLLGGSIWLNSEPDKGSEFYFTIPSKFVEPETESSISINDFIYNGIQKVILVAEDEINNFSLIKEMLEGSNFTLIHAQDGLEAIDIFENRNDIDLVLMDLKMPILNGFDATLKIREKNKTIPIIAQTAYNKETDHEMANKYGFTDFISKPYSIQELFQIIEKNLSLKEK